MFLHEQRGRIPRTHLLSATLLLAVIACQASGCSQEELKQAYNNAQQATTAVSSDLAETTKQVTQQAVVAVEAKLPEDGSIELQSDSPIESTSTASIEVIVIGDGRPSSMQLSSYDPDAQRMTYPAIHLHGATSATEVASLSGTTVQCDVYLQSSSADPVAMTFPGQTASVVFGRYNAEEKSISASLNPTKLIRSDDQTIAINGGKIVAVVREAQL